MQSERVKDNTGCFSPRRHLSRLKDNYDTTWEEQPDVLLLLLDWRKSKVTNPKRGYVWGEEGFSLVNLPLSSLLFIVSVCVTSQSEAWPGLTYRPDTHWQTTNLSKGQGRRGWEHLLPHKTNTSLSAPTNGGSMDWVIVDRPHTGEGSQAVDRQRTTGYWVGWCVTCQRSLLLFLLAVMSHWKMKYQYL